MEDFIYFNIMKENNVGYNLKQIRLASGLSQEKFGSKIGVSGSCIQHWEANYTEPDIDAMRKIKEVFGVSYDEIIDGNL